MRKTLIALMFAAALPTVAMAMPQSAVITKKIMLPAGLRDFNCLVFLMILTNVCFQAPMIRNQNLSHSPLWPPPVQTAPSLR